MPSGDLLLPQTVEYQYIAHRHTIQEVERVAKTIYCFCSGTTLEGFLGYFLSEVALFYFILTVCQ